MDRVNRILKDEMWRERMELIKKLEEGRPFCGHDAAHLFDVARLAYIEALERGVKEDKELIYAAALLHDIGRSDQYETGIPHHIGGTALAGQIAERAGFTCEETEAIKEAVSGHRDEKSSEDRGLRGLIYRADKKSRMCCLCHAEGECNWSDEKKNMEITG